MEFATNFSSVTAFISLAILCCSLGASSDHVHHHRDFLKCLSHHQYSCNDCTSTSNVIVYAPNNSSYLSTLQASIKNLRFSSPNTRKPLYIMVPTTESQVQAVVHCAKQNGLQIRVKSGGHDFEGLSYTTKFKRIPFLVLDLQNMSKISVDVETRSAWVQSGATLGQLYYRIAEKNQTLAFPAGICPTIGVGGHFSGGGYGYLLRKYGLAADNIIDAHLIDVNGRLLDRKSMGEDLFWAIRGAGGTSFGIVIAWKIQLVVVPEKVTLFTTTRDLQQNATQLFHKWQSVAANLPEEIVLSAQVQKVNSSIRVTFNSLFLGEIDSLLSLLQEKFPELGIRREDCSEVSWIQSVLFFALYPKGTSPEVLLSRAPSSIQPVLHFKATLDYIEEPIPEEGLEGIWKFLHESVADLAFLDIAPDGGIMEEIPESAIPFPHRAGNLYKIISVMQWNASGTTESKRHINWSRRLYSYLTPYVSKNPRGAYVNCKDLDLGVNNEDNTSYAQASIWGLKYYKNNFNRLVRIKTKVDPTNFLKNEQSIPPLYS